jgi:hypothetical protein
LCGYGDAGVEWTKPTASIRFVTNTERSAFDLGMPSGVKPSERPCPRGSYVRTT